MHPWGFCSGGGGGGGGGEGEAKRGTEELRTIITLDSDSFLSLSPCPFPFKSESEHLSPTHRINSEKFRFEKLQTLKRMNELIDVFATQQFRSF